MSPGIRIDNETGCEENKKLNESEAEGEGEAWRERDSERW